MPKRKKKHFVFLMDSHPLYSDGYEKILRKMFIIGELYKSTNVHNIDFSSFDTLENQIAILDICNLNTADLEFLIGLHLRHPKLKIIISSSSEAPEFIKKCLVFGASGFISKRTPVAIIKRALQDIDNDVKWIPKELLKQQPQEFKLLKENSERINLSKRELQTLQFILQGMINRDIASKMGVRVSTTKSHVSSILKKLGVISRTQIVHEYLKFDHQLKFSPLEGNNLQPQNLREPCQTI